MPEQSFTQFSQTQQACQKSFNPPEMNVQTDVGNLFFTGDLVHIVGTIIDDLGGTCDAHSPLPYGSALRLNDWMIFRLVPLDTEGLEENAIEVPRIVQGEITCRLDSSSAIMFPTLSPTMTSLRK